MGKLFQPAPPVGAETSGYNDPTAYAVIFQPTPPVGAETESIQLQIQQQLISTHSARGGGDGLPSAPL